MSSLTNDEIKKLLQKLRQRPENKTCIDCNTKNPDWVSVPFGVWVCIECSGAHRKLGTHITFVRSPTLDDRWTPEQYKSMELGGNNKARVFFQKNGISEKKIPQKYSGSPAKLYKKELKNLVEKDLDIKKETDETEDFEPKSAPAKLSNDNFDFMESVKEESEKQQFKIVQREKSEKIVIQKKKPSPNLTPKRSLTPTIQSSKKQEDEDINEDVDEEDDWNNSWGEEKKKNKNKNENWDDWDNDGWNNDKEKEKKNPTKYVGIGSRDSNNIDYEQLERLKRKKRQQQEGFLDMSNDDKLEYVKELGNTISEKTVEYGSTVYSTVSDYSEQASEAVGNWFSGLMSQ
eukprot:gene6604-10767_t